MSELTRYEQGFGSFRIGEMTLALSMKSVREVVPFHSLQALPCPQAWVKGGLNLRGVSIPVLDMECLLGRPGHVYAPGCILLVAHEDHLLGLIADQVKALFFADPADVHPVNSSDPIAGVFAGSLMNTELNQLVSVLDPAALFRLPGLPKAKDPEPHRQSLEQQTSTDDVAVNTRAPLMLMQSASTLFAVNPKDIETTVVNPVLLPSEYAGGYYKGNLNYREQTIPAIDLAAYLDMGAGQRTTQQTQQAFVLRINNNPLAFLIDRVLDIVHVAQNAVLALPPFGLSKAAQLQGALPCTAFEKSDAHSQRGPQYFVLSCSSICEDQELLELANILAKANASAQQNVADGSARKAADLDRLMVYRLDTEFSTPIDQVREVLPYRADIEIFERSNPMLGMLTHRDESVPVFDLAQWLGAARQSLSKESSILLINAHGVTIGFAVSSLTAIENAQWEPSVPVLGDQRQVLNGRLKTSQRLAEIGAAPNCRMVEVIDLQHQVLLILDQYGLKPTEQAVDHSLGCLPHDAHEIL
ncbi:chemotaxis protein CheW [Limnobacter parvus]|uniref:Chemotaxis protein CheW n=1 Tax=Limnobacter parvus TaxID=2939690 RepID=A0ABT1XHX1_9BURK|nr:chemotaxis protein CheW [Limnobacter parvus]MCR2745669.1 chemotaxis protein CheW [Limnobacter parvus]